MKEEKALWTFFLWNSFFLGFVLTAVGCSGVSKAFLQGEEAAYKAVSGEYIAYVSSDTRLDKSQKEDRKRTIRAWRFSLDQASKVAK